MLSGGISDDGLYLSGEEILGSGLAGEENPRASGLRGPELGRPSRIAWSTKMEMLKADSAQSHSFAWDWTF